jgi:hypothetical protein
VYSASAWQDEEKRPLIQTVGALGRAMIESVKIQNFRCFSELEVHGLKPINILVGENASGKSAFLEAIYLALTGMPSSAFQLREWRQMGQPRESAFASLSSSEIWDDLFHNYNSARPIAISIENAKPSPDVLRIQRDGTGIKFLWKSAEYSSEFVSSPEHLKPIEGLSSGLHDANPVEFIGSHTQSVPQWLASRFSNLSKEGETAPVLDALRIEFPFLKELSLELDAGNPSVFASIEGSKRKLPAALVSDGFNKLLGILLSIASASKGTLLIDQIEDGFYFKKLPSIWKTIHKFAKANGTQIFATTHSQECLDALLPTLEANEDDFALIRASRSEDSIVFRVANGRQFGSVLSQGFEVR